MEVILNLSQVATSAQLLLQSIYFNSLIWVSQGLHLSLLVDVLRLLSEHLLFIAIVTSLLILETIHPVGAGLSAGLVGLQSLHKLISGDSRCVNSFPDRLRFVHKWILFRYLEPLDDILSLEDFGIICSQLKHLVRELLLWALIFLQLLNLIRVLQKFLQHSRITSNVVHIGWELRLLLIQFLENLLSGDPICGENFSYKKENWS